MTGGQLDVLALRRDDELLDALGDRRSVASDDPTALLLQAFAADVDQDLADLFAALDGAVDAPNGMPGGVPAQRDEAVETAHAADRVGGRRRRLTAAATAAFVLGGTLSVSGVAAAVTGDPFAPYRAVGDALSFGSDLPPQAAEVAHLNKRLAGARAALAHGKVDQVRDLVAALQAELGRSDLTPAQRAKFEHKLDVLAAAIARAESAAVQRGSEARATPTPKAGKDRKDPDARTTRDADRSSDGSSNEQGDDADATEQSRDGDATAPRDTSRPAQDKPRPEPTVPVSPPDAGTTPTDDGDQSAGGESEEVAAAGSTGGSAQKAPAAPAQGAGGATARR